ncbi:hypothetical protein FJZ53_00685 [Candidatus Woesearchaeota archaeon]|nr:hypothetical protein [Candidatus Woesearchaeota archaeon]
MNRTTKTVVYLMLIVLLLTSMLFINGCGGKKKKLPCIPPLIVTGQAPGGLACYNQCGSPAECHYMAPNGKGSGCDYGQTCTKKCVCNWIDRDLDGYTTETCVEDQENDWLSLDEAEVTSEGYTWDVSQNSIKSSSLYFMQTKGNPATNVYKIDIYSPSGLFQSYNYESEPNGYYPLSPTNKLTLNFGTAVDINSIVISWDDQGMSNAVKPVLYVKAGSSSCDCNDNDGSIYPTAPELCDNIDNDCDGSVDEDDVCKRNIYICKTDSFTTNVKGDGKELSSGSCNDGEWCSAEAIGEKGSCSYMPEEQEGLGQHEFFVYVCDRYSCFKFTKGKFFVCGEGVNCTNLCKPGNCNYETQEWCNEIGLWEKNGYCHSECGKTDSRCEGECVPGTCDLTAKKVCRNDKYWVSTDYCNCNVCGSKDSSCTSKTGCSCKVGDCDVANGKYCENNIWKSETNCTSCCHESYSCYAQDYCNECTTGTCDTTNNQYCKNGVWTSKDYCDNCVCCDFDCGLEPCSQGACDPYSHAYCNNGVWQPLAWPNPYCFPGYCGKDPACDCTDSKDGCCKGDSNGVCDTDCTEETDTDCVGRCTTNANDCCNPMPDGTCDTDCLAGQDPDCQECQITHDNCCSGLDDNNCDIDCTDKTDINCVGICTKNGNDCCTPKSDGLCDPDCLPGQDPDCFAHPCDENWVCEEWDRLCDGVNDQHTCKKWVDKSGCNTFYEKPEDFQNCYVEFTCTADDDKDGDSYPRRACYDAVNQKVLEELDCDDSDAAQNPDAEEICNGEDDDCDDSKDEGCPCVEGNTQSCGRSQGACRPGLQLCVAGYWGLCGGSGYIAPGKEVCDDGNDNNCDGYVDENCVCVEGAKQDCGADVGICKKGWQACYNGSFGSVCNEEAKGSTEVCDNKLDDDCDTFTDGDDSSCQVTTPVTSGAEHCKNRKQDAGETGVDCGDGKDCPDCAEKAPACSYGAITEKCTCGKAEYKTGYCCNGKYSLMECKEPAKDSDSDGCTDDKELQVGTDVNSGDTDGDGLLDCDPSEANPLCNEDGVCDTERDYPESLENCPEDCGKKGGVGWLTWLTLLLILLSLTGVGAYLYAKSKGCKLSDFIKIRGKKKEEKQSLPLGDYKPAIPAAQPAQYTKPAQSTILKHPMQPTVIKPATGKGRELIRLQGFVDNCLRKGYTKLQIKNAALKFGWTEEEVENAFQGKKSKYSIFK